MFFFPLVLFYFRTNYYLQRAKETVENKNGGFPKFPAIF